MTFVTLADTRSASAGGSISTPAGPVSTCSAGMSGSFSVPFAFGSPSSAVRSRVLPMGGSLAVNATVAPDALTVSLLSPRHLHTAANTSAQTVMSAQAAPIASETAAGALQTDTAASSYWHERQGSPTRVGCPPSSVARQCSLATTLPPRSPPFWKESSSVSSSSDASQPSTGITGLTSTPEALSTYLSDLSADISSLKSNLKSQQILLAQIAECILGDKVPQPASVTSQVADMEATLQDVCLAIATQHRNQELQAHALCEGLQVALSQQSASTMSKSSDIDSLSASVDTLHSFVNEQIESMSKEIAHERKARLVREAQEARERISGTMMFSQQEELDKLRMEFAQEFKRHIEMLYSDRKATDMLRFELVQEDEARQNSRPSVINISETDPGAPGIQATQEVEDEDAQCSQTSNSETQIADMIQKVLDRTNSLEREFVLAKGAWDHRSATDIDTAAQVQHLIMESHQKLRSCFSERLSEVEQKLQQQADVKERLRQELMCRLDDVEEHLNGGMKKQLACSLGMLLSSSKGEQWRKLSFEEVQGDAEASESTLPAEGALMPKQMSRGRTQWTTKFPRTPLIGTKQPRGAAAVSTTSSTDKCSVKSVNSSDADVSRSARQQFYL